jgi:DNA repair protein RadD
MRLRPYQTDAIDGLFDYFETNYGNPLVVMPTGTGKSVVIGGFIQTTFDHFPGTRIVMLTHVKELIAQNFAALIRMWPGAPAGIYSAGLNKRDIGAEILIAGIQSIHKKAYHVQRCDIVLIDECHLIGRAAGGMYKQFIDDLRSINPLLKVIGFTATPYRMDSGRLHEGEGALFTDIAVNIPILDMFKQGYLSPVTTQPTTTHIDLTGVRTQGGEFSAGDLERASMAGETINLAVNEIVTLGADRRAWLIFCAGVKSALETRDAIRAHGITCETVTGDTPAGERDRILRDFKSGKLRAVTNAAVLTTGFDAPIIDLIALMTSTKSKGRYVQIIGRGTRLCDGKEDCLVLDFGGNVDRHGPIDLIDGDPYKKKGDGAAPVKKCPECDKENYAGVRFCIECGFEFPPPETDIADKASEAAIISTQAVATWVDVDAVSYRLHAKEGKPPSMMADYQCGLTRHREWICLEHTGTPREMAAKWWMAHSADPLPKNVGDALALAPNFRKPTAIRVKPDGKYMRIQSHRFA